MLLDDDGEEIVSVRDKPLCWCGRAKFAKHALCGTCWRKLNDDQKNSLYLPSPHFDVAYERVLEHLRHRTQRIRR